MAAKGKRKTKAAKAAAMGEIPAEFANPENFVDGVGYREKCVIDDCDIVTDGGAVIRTGELAGERYSLCPDHRHPEGLLEAAVGPVSGDTQAAGGANDPASPAVGTEGNPASSE